jgi:N-acetylglucosamine-6-phosphate deacetylase
MEIKTEITAIHYETGKNVRLGIEDGLITEIEETGTAEHTGSLIVAPGFIDNQINGYKGVDFSDDGLTTEKMVKAVENIQRDGVTSFQPTIITNSHENLIRNFRNLTMTMKDKDISDSVPGFHLEGPYISSEEGFYGCHPREHIRKPSWEEFLEYQEAADGNIRQVTLAPEEEGAIDFILNCVRNNIIVAIGHTNASAEQIKRAVDSGATISTHLGNGCANFIHRHKNPLWPQLSYDLLSPSIIADGHHLLQEEIRVFYRIKGPGNIFLTSDVTNLIGLNPGKYMFMGSEIVLSDDGVIRNPLLNCLAGASFPIRRGVENMMAFTGCSMAEAINLASGNVARICKINDRGFLEPGKRADLILFETEGNSILIKKTIVNGRIVYS